MIIDKELVLKAKEKLGSEAALIIAKDLNLEKFDEKNLKACCHWHSENTPSLIWNPKENCFHCFSCNKNYGIIDHYIEHYGLTFLEAVEKLFSVTDTRYTFGEKNVKTKKDYKYPPHISAPDRSKVEKYMLKRGISTKVLDYCDVQQDKQNNLVWHFYDENDTLTTVKIRNLHSDDPKEWYLPNYGESPVLYNMNKIDITRPLVITEGQIDCLSIIECGYSNVVSVPGGANNLKWIETNFEWLRGFSKIVIWADNDVAGMKMRKEACSRLGAWRSLFVDLPVEVVKDDVPLKVKDANDVLVKLGKEDVLNYIDNASEVPIQNVINLAEADDFDIETAEGLYTHIKALDDIVYKFVMGNVVILTGLRGGGKSSFLNQAFICEGLDQGYDSFIFSGELSSPLLKNWVELTMAGPNAVNIKSEHIRKIDPVARKEMRNWYSNRVFIYDNPTDNTSESVLTKAEEVVRKYGVKIVVLDNLLTLDLNEDENTQWQRQKQFMVKLLGFASSLNCLVVLIVHPRKLQAMLPGQHLTADDVGGSASITNLAQYMLSLHRYTDKEKEGEKDKNGNYKKGHEPIKYDCYCEILKNRLSGKLGTVDLYFANQCYRYYQTPEELYRRYKWDKSTSPIPKKDPNKHETVPDFMKDD